MWQLLAKHSSGLNLEKLKKEIAQWTITLNAKKQETASIQRDAEIFS